MSEPIDLETLKSRDPISFVRAKLAQDERFIRDHNGYCTDYIQDGRAEVIGNLLEQYDHWQLKAEEWVGEEQYCNVRAEAYRDVLEVIAESGFWDD